MITFHTQAEVPEDRRLLVVLPAETPLGRADVTVTVSTPCNGGEKALTDGDDLRSLFGSVHSGDPRSGDNDRIDADLARVYDDLQN